VRPLLVRAARREPVDRPSFLSELAAGFVAGFVAGFSSGVVTTVVAALVVGSLLLAPAIVVGHAVRAADRDDREHGIGV